jgi:putative phage-type endonuclease
MQDTTTMTREQWLEERRKGIGGSDAAGILGLSPFSTPLSVWNDKIGRSKPIEETESMWLGTNLEEAVAERAAAEDGIQVERLPRILVHPDHDWMLGNIDFRVAGANEGVEIKTTSPFSRVDFASGDIPPHYYVQCMHYMAVTGWDSWRLYVYKLCDRIYSFTIPRDEFEIEQLIEAERHFWMDYVQTGIMPDTSVQRSQADALAPKDAGAIFDAEAEYDCSRHKELTAQIKALTAEKDELARLIQCRMQSAEKLETQRYKVSWSWHKGKESIDKDALLKNEPEIHARYLNVGEPYRVFKINLKRGIA